MTPTIMSAD